MADSNGAFPELTIDVGQSAQYNTSQPISTLEQAVEGTLREVLAWRPRTTDPKGFLAALNQAFTEQEVDGHSTWAWTPRSYSVQADMGAVTGAQASIYARARAALDQSVPLIEGLRPLRADADDEDVEAIRALVQSQLTELIDELGVVGGPRQDRIKGLFNTLLGNKTPADPDDVHGLLGLMRDRFGLERQRVNTVEEEQNLTNFRIIVDHVIGLKRSWKTLKHYFDRDGTDVFLGTQLVLLSRSLDVIAESVRELYFKLDSVWLGAAERQTVTLKSGLTIAELLSWVERFAGEEAPRIIREAGKDGVVALQPTLEKLQNLVQSAWDESKGAGNNPQAGFHRERIQIGLEEMTLHLREAAKLASQIRREPAPMITAVFPDHAYVNDKVWLTVNGRYFQDGAKVQLRKVSVTDPSKNLEIKAAHVTVVSDTQICANFDLTGAKSGTWQVVITNPDGSENEPKNNTFTIEEPPNDDDKPAPEPFQVEMIEVITVTGAKLDNDVV
ncbi:MAG: hypothetical protein IAF02_11825, partial [Anaerolineae bacterium]|nr:hypothetical protein [Anaerolineae bacterium]